MALFEWEKAEFVRIIHKAREDDADHTWLSDTIAGHVTSQGRIDIGENLLRADMTTSEVNTTIDSLDAGIRAAAKARW